MRIILLAGWVFLFGATLHADDEVGVHNGDGTAGILQPRKDAPPEKRIVPATSSVEGGAPRSSAVIPPRGTGYGSSTGVIPADSLPDWGPGMTIGGVLLFAVGLALWLKLRKRGGYLPKGGRLMRLVSSLDIPGGRVTMVEVGETLYLVGNSEGGGVACLDRITDPGTRARWLAGEHNMRVASGEEDASFQDEYSEMIGRMSAGTQRSMEPEPETVTGKFQDELDGLKQRLRDLA